MPFLGLSGGSGESGAIVLDGEMVPMLGKDGELVSCNVVRVASGATMDLTGVVDPAPAVVTVDV